MSRLARALGVVVVALSLVSTPAVAQEGDGATIAQTVIVKPLPGHGAAFEQGVRDHFEWLGDQGLDWTWLTWEVTAGPRTGSFLVGTFGHNWSDFDDPPVDPQAAAQSIDERIAPHVDEVQISYYRTLEGLSMPPAAPGQSPMAQIVTFWVNPGHEQQFELAVQLFRDAFEQGLPDAEFTFYQLALGGEGGTQYVVGIPYANFAAMDGMGATGGFNALLEAAYGETGSDEIQEMLNEAVANVQDELLVLRPDLSYRPGT